MSEVVNINKQDMEKLIPKDTVYCHSCPWRKFIKTIYYNKDEENCPYLLSCQDHDKCWTIPSTSCRVNVWRCEYLDYTDETEESLLWDGCKECGVGYPDI